jgi:Rrf2 family protein
MLSVTSQYALRALTQLAALPEGEALLGRQLAKDCSIPPHYLTHIFVTLRNAGFVGATRGVHGGYRLLRRAGEIHLSDVIELFEGSQDAPGCFLYSERPCGRGAELCLAHPAWEKVQTAYVQFLKSTTLANIAPSAAKEIP